MKKIFILLLFIFLIFAGLSAENLKLMRTPDASSDKVCFIYENDLFTADLNGNNLKRIVKAVGIESNPKFSPDGKWIGFSSTFNGNRNVYIIPSYGRKMKQVTYEPEGAYMLEWGPKGKYIYYLSNAASHSPYFSRIFKVTLKGGIAETLPVDQASTISFNDKGDSYVLNRHSLYFWWWKRYKGTANTDIWLYDGKTAKYKNLTKTLYNESWPIWVGDYIYFVSEENGPANIYKFSLKKGKRTQITKHIKDDVQFPSLSSDKKFIVYECNNGIYKLNIKKETSDEIIIPSCVESVVPEYEYINPQKLITTFDISPTGKRVVFSARGEIFSAPAKYGEIRQLTFNSASRDEEPVWSSKGDKIAFISDMDGEENIYLIDQFAKGKAKKLTNRKNKFIEDLRFSPNADFLSYKTNDFKLWVFDIKNKKEILVSQSPLFGQFNYNWAPDNNWIIYSVLGKNLVSEIRVFNINERKEHMLFKSFEQNSSPVFSKDGKHIYFVTSRAGDKSRIVMLSLQKEKKDPLEHEWDEEKVKKESKEKKEKKIDKKDKKKEKKEVNVKINFKEIMKRITLFPITGYRYINIKAETNGLYIGFMPKTEEIKVKEKRSFKFNYDLYLYDFKTEKLKDIAKSINGYTISHDGKKILLFKNKGFQIIDAGKKAGKDGKISLSKLSMKLDRKAEWLQIFDESWRMVRDRFYDENLHGVKWNKMKTKYKKMITSCQTRYDVNRVLVQLVGELNASHQGARGGDSLEKPKRVQIGSIGAILVPDKSGFYKFEKIYKGNSLYSMYNAPLDKPYIKIKKGDYLIAINNNKVNTKKDYRTLLINTVGKTIFLKVNNKPSGEGAWEIKMKSISSERNLRYLDWVEHNRELVNKKSEGKLGYIHLNVMSSGQLSKFYNYIQAYFDKQGLILDVRFNGGGGIDPQLIDFLERKQYQVVRLRDSVDIPRPTDIFRGKVVVLCNEHSYSDAEVFPNAFKVRGLGKVIGVQTLGFVIAVNSYGLIDGGIIRRTFIGIWDIFGNQLETRGAIPDIIVENDPNDLAKGIDAQLNRAIVYLNEELAKEPVHKKIKTLIRPR